MRVLIVSHRFYGQSHGGTEVLANNAAVALRRKGHSVIWVAVGPEGEPPQSAPVRRLRTDGVEEWQAPAAFSDRYPITWRRDEEAQTRNVEACLDAFLDGRAIDAVHLFHFARIGLGFLELPALAGVRCVATLTDYTAVCADFQLYDRGREAICSGRVPSANCAVCVTGCDRPSEDVDRAADEVQAWRDRNARVFNRRVDAIFVQTPHQKKRLRDLGLRHARFVSDVAAYELPPSWPANGARRGGGFAFGFVGRASREKGVHIAVEAFTQLKRATSAPDVHLKIVTDDPVAARTKFGGAATPEPNIDWAEPVPFPEIGPLLRELDCLLVPSIWLENHPTILTYALSLGVPVICADAPSMTHLADQPLLSFARTGDIEDWARRMQEKLDRPAMPEASTEATSLPDFAALVDKMELQYREVEREPH